MILFRLFCEVRKWIDLGELSAKFGQGPVAGGEALQDIQDCEIIPDIYSRSLDLRSWGD